MRTYAYLNTSIGLHSVSEQLETIESFLQLKQLHIDEIYAEETGKNNMKHYLERNLVDLCCSLLPKDILIISNVVHITRACIGELYDFIERYVKPYQIRFIICDIELDMDFTDRNSMVIIQHKMMEVLSKTEKQLIQERTKAALEKRKQKLASEGSFLSKNGNVVTSLGRPKGCKASQNAIDASVAASKGKARANPHNVHFLREMNLWEKKNGTLKSNADIQAFADELNSHDFKTATGMEFDLNRCRSMIVKIKRLFDEENSLTIIEKKTDAIEFSIDKTDLSIDSQSFSMDLNKLQIHQLQTKEAQEILSDIFVDDEIPMLQNSESLSTSSIWMGILKELFDKESWERTEVENMCKARGVMLGAILEQINDYAYEKIDDAVVDDDGDNIYVTIDYKEQLI